MKMNSSRKNEAGITLVELAIGIVIVALLLATVVAGKNLSRAGKLRAVMSEVEDHRGAVVRFFDKYGDLPGDMTDADEILGNGATNGNGNERIEWSTGEGPMAWKHLQLAKMLSASVMTGTGGVAIVGQNVPASKLPGAGFYLDYDAATVGNLLGLGAAKGGGVNDDPIVRPEDAMNIDLKLDDGNANSGRVRSMNRTTSTLCTDAFGTYAILETVPQCAMIFQLDNAL